MQDGDKAPLRYASVRRRPSRFGALYSITLVPLRVEILTYDYIPPPSEVAPSTLRYQDYGIQSTSLRYWCKFYEVLLLHPLRGAVPEQELDIDDCRSEDLRSTRCSFV